MLCALCGMGNASWSKINGIMVQKQNRPRWGLTVLLTIRVKLANVGYFVENYGQEISSP